MIADKGVKNFSISVLAKRKSVMIASLTTAFQRPRGAVQQVERVEKVPGSGFKVPG